MMRIKNYILTVLQCPLLVFWYVTELVRLLLIKGLACLANPALDSLAKIDLLQKEHICPQCESCSGGKNKLTVQQLALLLRWVNPLEVTKLRQILEQTKTGREVVRRKVNRHLYAVYKPNNKENILRIASVLSAMDEEQQKHILRNAERVFFGSFETFV